MTEILVYEALDNIEKLKKRAQDLDRLIQELANKIALHRTSIPIDHPDGAITRAKLFGVFPISTADIADGSITTPKIADGAITAGKLADQSVTPAKLATVNTPSDGYVPAFDATGMFKWIPVTGLTIHDKSYHKSPALPDDDVHRTSIPIDHPDRSVTRDKLEYPTADVSFAYLGCINKLVFCSLSTWGCMMLTKDVFTDKAIFVAVQCNDWANALARFMDYYNTYETDYYLGASSNDFILRKVVSGSTYNLATEAINLDNKGRGIAISCTGTTIKAMRYEMLTPVDPVNLPTPDRILTATDTAFSSGRLGFRFLRETTPHGGASSAGAYLKNPMSPSPQVVAYFEVPVIGSGTPEDPFRPQLPEEITWNWDLNPQAKRKYDILKAKGFTDDEIFELFPEVLSCRTNRLALTHSALIVSDTATGKPKEYTAIVRIFDQPDRQPHLHPIGRCIAELRQMKGARKLERDEAIRRAKQLDDKLHDVDLLPARELRKDKKQLKREYMEWRRSQFKVEMEDGIAEQYVEEDKGW